MKSSRLYRQQFWLILLLVGLTLSLLGGSFFFLSYRYTVNERQDNMEQNAQAVARLSTYLFLSNDFEQVMDARTWVSFVSGISDSDVLICTLDGTLVAASDLESSADFSAGRIPEEVAHELLQGGEYSGFTDLGGVYSENRFTVGVPVTYLDRPLGMALITADVSALTQMWKTMVWIFLFTATAIFFLAFFTTGALSKWQIRPLREMAEAAKLFARGKFNVRVRDYGRDDEVGELARSFNAMAGSLAESERKRSEFIANVSHELKTPMTTISGFADGILDGTVPPEESREYLQAISDETKRLSRLVRRMLEISRLQSGESIQLIRFDLSDRACRALLSLESKITSRGLDVEAELPEDPVYALGDPDMIEQVVYNLLENAAKFAPEGTALGLRLQIQGDRALLAVRNRGETIPPEELPRIFDRFHKTDKSRSLDKEGVGLGLSIVQTIVNLHNEQVEVTSQDGVTEFSFALQLADADLRPGGEEVKRRLEPVKTGTKGGIHLPVGSMLSRKSKGFKEVRQKQRQMQMMTAKRLEQEAKKLEQKAKKMEQESGGESDV